MRKPSSRFGKSLSLINLDFCFLRNIRPSLHWKVKHCLTAFSISAFIFTQYTDSHASNLVFSTAMWLLCSCLNICICNWDGIITHFNLLSIIANSCLMGLYLCMSCTTSFFSSQPCMICDFSSCSFTSLTVASCISHIDVSIERSTAVSIMLIFMLRPHISSSLFSSQLCHDSQSAVSSSRPGLYTLHALYWYLCPS